MTLLTFLQTNPFFFILFIGVLGLLIGSFLNVVIHRLPIMLEREWQTEAKTFLELPVDEKPAAFNLLTPRSQCPHCQHTIRPWENIPLLSFLFLRAKCSQCAKGISFRYPLIEFTCGALSFFLAWHFGFTAATFGALIFTWTLLAASWIDIDHQIIPDNISLPILWLGLVFNLFAVYTTIESALMGAIAGYLSLWSIAHLFKALTGKEGMGQGDFKLLALLGAWLGWQMLPFIILCSSLLGALFGIAILFIKGEDKSTPIPFGPYLAFAGWIALVWGQDITQWYLHYAGLTTF